MEAEICFTLHRSHFRLNKIYPSELRQAPFSEILVKLTNLVGMIVDQTFYEIGFTFFTLRLRLRPTDEGQSFSEPNI